jgi:nucleotide-binding universal stress UspA family protein
MTGRDVVTDLLAPPAKHATSPEPKAERASAKPPMRVLAVVDGTECAGRVIKGLLDLQAQNDAIEVVLLNVQPRPEDGRLRGYGSFRRTAIEDRLINDVGNRIVASASRHLDAADIVHKQRIELGNPTETIIRCADDEKCDLIVMAEPKLGIARRWLMQKTGLVVQSVASVVIHLASVPVMVVK